MEHRNLAGFARALRSAIIVGVWTVALLAAASCGDAGGEGAHSSQADAQLDAPAADTLPSDVTNDQAPGSVDPDSSGDGDLSLGDLDAHDAGESNTTTGFLGPEGGVLFADDVIRLEVPADCLEVETQVSITVDSSIDSEPRPPIGTRAEVSLDPAPSGILPCAVRLTFLDTVVPEDAIETVYRMTAMETTGSVEPDEGDALPEAVWIPLSWSRRDSDGHPTAVLWSFSTYGASADRARWEVCGPDPDQMTPPPAPEGYDYAGVKVFVNLTMDLERSTLPPGFPPHSPSNIQRVSASSNIVDGVGCHVVVSHIFVPSGSLDLQCVPPPDLTTCEPPRTDYEFIGYDLVVNYEMTASTIPLTRPERTDDLNMIRSRTRVEDGVTVCDFTVRCLYEHAPMVCCDTGEGYMMTREAGCERQATDEELCDTVCCGSLGAMSSGECADIGGHPPQNYAVCEEVCCDTGAGRFEPTTKDECNRASGVSGPVSDCESVCCAVTRPGDDLENGQWLMPRALCSALGTDLGEADLCENVPMCATPVELIWDTTVYQCAQLDGVHWPDGDYVNPYDSDGIWPRFSFMSFGRDNRELSVLGAYRDECEYDGATVVQTAELSIVNGDQLLFEIAPGCMDDGTGCIDCDACDSAHEVLLTRRADSWGGSWCDREVTLELGGDRPACCELEYEDGRIEYRWVSSHVSEPVGVDMCHYFYDGTWVGNEYCQEVCCEIAGEYVSMSLSDCTLSRGDSSSGRGYCEEVCCREYASGDLFFTEGCFALGDERLSPPYCWFFGE